jgi:hypothetical protein
MPGKIHGADADTTRLDPGPGEDHQRDASPTRQQMAAAIECELEVVAPTS